MARRTSPPRTKTPASKKRKAPSGAAAGAKTRKSPPSAILQLVGERIREVRRERGLSQDLLAYSTPLDRAHIGMIENGKRAATILTLVKLAAALECEVGDLFPPIDELSPYLPES